MKGSSKGKILKFEKELSSFKHNHKQIWEKRKNLDKKLKYFENLSPLNNNNKMMFRNRFDSWAVLHNCLIALFIAFKFSFFIFFLPISNKTAFRYEVHFMLSFSTYAHTLCFRIRFVFSFCSFFPLLLSFYLV